MGLNKIKMCARYSRYSGYKLMFKVSASSYLLLCVFVLCNALANLRLKLIGIVKWPNENVFKMQIEFIYKSIAKDKILSE